MQARLGFVDAKTYEIVRSWSLEDLEEWLRRELEVAEQEAVGGLEYWAGYADALRDVLSKINELRGEA